MNDKSFIHGSNSIIKYNWHILSVFWNNTSIRHGVTLSPMVFNKELETVERHLLDMDEGIQLRDLILS